MWIRGGTNCPQLLLVGSDGALNAERLVVCSLRPGLRWRRGAALPAAPCWARRALHAAEPVTVSGLVFPFVLLSSFRDYLSDFFHLF